MSTKIGSQQKLSPEDNTGGGRTNTSASRCNHTCLETSPAALTAETDVVLAAPAVFAAARILIIIKIVTA